MKSLTVEVPQGIGDIFWCHQKLLPHYDMISYEILCVDLGKVQTRAKDWLGLLPKTWNVTTKVVTSAYYHSICDQYHSLQAILDGPERNAYAVNHPLEQGIRLEDVDPGYEPQWAVPLKSEPWQLPYKAYWTVYVSGGLVGWTVQQWAELIERLNPPVPLVLIGAEYDRRAIEPLARTLPQTRREATFYLDLPPARVLHLLQHTEFFICYQSGLGILADNLGVKQFMLYFSWLEKLMFSWCRPEHIGTVFRAGQFSSSPAEIASQILS